MNNYIMNITKFEVLSADQDLSLKLPPSLFQKGV